MRKKLKRPAGSRPAGAAAGGASRAAAAGWRRREGEEARAGPGPPQAPRTESAGRCSRCCSRRCAPTAGGSAWLPASCSPSRRLHRLGWLRGPRLADEMGTGAHPLVLPAPLVLIQGSAAAVRGLGVRIILLLFPPVCSTLRVSPCRRDLGLPSAGSRDFRGDAPAPPEPLASVAPGSGAGQAPGTAGTPRTAVASGIPAGVLPEREKHLQGACRGDEHGCCR